MKPSSLAATLAALLLVAAPAAAQDAYVEQVRIQIDEAAATLMADGYESTHDVWTDALYADEGGTITVQLDAGTEYVILGVCDEDCYDLDLFVTGPDGSLVDSDTEIDDVPLVGFTPAHSGAFLVEIAMVDCEVGPCAYGVAVFGR